MSIVENTNNLVPFYKELLQKAVPENSSSINQCVLKGWLHNLGHYLKMDSIRLYLYDDRSNNVLIHHVYGDKDIWKDVNIVKLRRERTKYKNLFFIKIRHIRENGQFLVLGYLAFHADFFVSDEMLMSLDVLCMLYGNYVVKRLIAGQLARMNIILPKAYNIATSDELPGTKFLNLLDCLHKLAGYNYGIFCTVHNNAICAEYLVTNQLSLILKKQRPWIVSNSFIRELEKNPKDYWYQLSEIPQRISNFILLKDKRSLESFSLQIYPVHVDGELVGLWMFVFSDNNPFVGFSQNNVLEGMQPLLRDSYRFLFQRRYKSMIVNPIFQNRDTRVKNDSVFVIMPFTQDWSSDVWEQVLKPAVQEMDMVPVRADDLYGQNIMEDVWQSILKAAIIICDTTGRNPNVFYELGIAHTLGKKVLLLTQNINDIPFDLQAYRHIEYKVTLSGGNQLKETIKKYIKETLTNS